MEQQIDGAHSALEHNVPQGSRGDIPNLPYDQELDHFATLAATICGTAMAAVTRIVADRQWIEGCVGLTHGEMPAEHSFCAHTVAAGTFLDVLDASADPRFRNNPSVTGEPHIRFYAGEPLDFEGHTVGALCVIDSKPRPEGLNAEQRRALALLAGQASLQLKLRLALAERDRAVSELNAAVARLGWTAKHDHLTGVGNRVLLRQVLDEWSSPGARPFGLFAIDVDHFKQINDSFGHQTGDEVLKEIAGRLCALVREGDVVVRLGGDEFSVLLRDVEDDDQLRALAGRILSAMRAPFIYDDRVLECRITIGGSLWPGHSCNVGKVVCYADAALYEAKARGRGIFVAFEERLLAEQSRRGQELAHAREALAAGQIVPFYQPKVDLADGTVLGLEALLRIVTADGTAELPHVIAASFDEAELAQAIGSELLTRVFGDMRSWLDAGLEFGRVAINVSATEVGDPTYAGRLLSALESYRLAPEMVELEILENVLLDQRSSAVLENVKALSQAGIQIAFDDFGTGYAALAHLPHFPVDTIKIDRSFVRDLDLPANQAIVRAVLALAEELGMEAVAEGVETGREAALLITMGCTIGQGFLYSPAVPGEAITALLPRQPRHHRSRPPVLADCLTLQRRAA